MAFPLLTIEQFIEWKRGRGEGTGAVEGDGGCAAESLYCCIEGNCTQAHYSCLYPGEAGDWGSCGACAHGYYSTPVCWDPWTGYTYAGVHQGDASPLAPTSLKHCQSGGSVYVSSEYGYYDRPSCGYVAPVTFSCPPRDAAGRFTSLKCNKTEWPEGEVPGPDEYETEQACMDSCAQWACVREKCVEVSLSEGGGGALGYGSREECEADDSPLGCGYVAPPARWRCYGEFDYHPVGPGCHIDPSAHNPDYGFGDPMAGTHASEEECEAACSSEPKSQWSCVEPEPGEGKRCVEVPAGEGVAGETYYQSLETCEDDCKNECAIEKTFQIKKGQTYVIEVDTNSVDKFNHKDHWWEIGFYKKTTETKTTTTGGGFGCACDHVPASEEHWSFPEMGLPVFYPAVDEHWLCRSDDVDPHTGLPLIVGSYGTSEECENDCTGEFHEECVVTPIETQTTETVTYYPAWNISTESITNCGLEPD